MRIVQTVETLCKKHDTRNPFELAKRLNINVTFEPLGSVRGFYARSFRHRVIHINVDLHEQQQLFTCAHELGHAIMHPNLNTLFLKTNTFFHVNKFETDANRFAVHMLYHDDFFKEMKDFTIHQVAACLNLPVSLVEYRLRSIK